jgi:acyl dehydratase
MPDSSETIENKTFEEITIGDRASLSRTLTRDDIDLFAVVSGDINPSHVDESFAGAAGPVAHSMWTGSLLSAVLGNELPGPGTVYHRHREEAGPEPGRVRLSVPQSGWRGGRDRDGGGGRACRKDRAAADGPAGGGPEAT